jgi:hypothetical protein
VGDVRVTDGDLKKSNRPGSGSLAGRTGQEDSLGRAVALALLRPIAVRLADQREREEAEARRQRAREERDTERRRAEREAAERERAEREVRISNGFATPADLDEILKEAADALSVEGSEVDVGRVWARLVASGAVGPPTHDIVTTRYRWPATSTLRFEELSRQPGWLVPDAQPFCFHCPGEDFEETRGLMDVWIAADGQTFRRENVFLPGCGQSLADHDARLTYFWHETRSSPVNVAVLVGEPPRTEEVSRFLLPRETKALRDTILLTEKGSRDIETWRPPYAYREHDVGRFDLVHDLGSTLAAFIDRLNRKS